MHNTTRRICLVRVNSSKDKILRCLFNEVATEMSAELPDRMQGETRVLFGEDIAEGEDPTEMLQDI